MPRPLQLLPASPRSGRGRPVGGVRPFGPVHCFLIAALSAALVLAWPTRDATTQLPSPLRALPASSSARSAPSPSLPVNAPRSAESDPVARAGQLAAADPDHAREHACAAIAALHRSGQAENAAAFALTSTLGPRRDLVIAAFFTWGQGDASSSLACARQIADRAVREIAIQATFSGWARNDPANLANFALLLPAGDERTTALTKALRYWSLRDSDATAAWIAAHEAVALPAAEIALRDD